MGRSWVSIRWWRAGCRESASPFPSKRCTRNSCSSGKLAGMKISWVFDLISPYSYLGLKQLPLLTAGTELELVPVLFGGLLSHHGQLGNAEIDSKRRFTYRFV